MTEKVRGNILLDVDDCMIPNTNNHGVTKPIPELVGLLHQLVSAKYRIVLITGQPIGIVNQVRKAIELHVWAGTEHGSLFYENGRREHLISEEELREYFPFRLKAMNIIEREGGSHDPTELSVISAMPKGKLRSTFELIASDKSAYSTFNQHDRRITILPKGTSKSNVLKRLAEPVLVGAGDSGSDFPILSASEYPIVTITAGKEPNKELASLVRDKKKGYIADQADGKGLYVGLLKAISEGVLTI